MLLISFLLAARLLAFCSVLGLCILRALCYKDRDNALPEATPLFCNSWPIGCTPPAYAPTGSAKFALWVMYPYELAKFGSIPCASP